MREIKFRGVSSAPLVGDDNFIVGTNLYINYEDNLAYINDMSVEFDSVSQYTGLKDKNGTEIYEGDIVEVTHEDEFKTIGQVVWGLDSHRYGNYPAFTIPEFDSDLNSFAEIFDSGNYDIEIIGNIYENPELVEDE